MSELQAHIENLKGGYPERIFPDETGPGAISWHLKKYEFACQMCKDKVVLDAGCGAGYGSLRLAQAARSVTGIDISPWAVEYAQCRYQNPRVRFALGDLAALPFNSHDFDVLCAFEVIEHLAEPVRFLLEAKRVLREAGLLIVSTPQVKVTNSRPQNPHHQIEYSLADFRALLSSVFTRVDILGQRRKQSGLHYFLQKADVLKVRTWGMPRLLRRNACKLLRTVPMEDLGLNDFEITSNMLARATELVAVCSLSCKQSPIG